MNYSSQFQVLILLHVTYELDKFCSIISFRFPRNMCKFRNRLVKVENTLSLNNMDIVADHRLVVFSFQTLQVGKFKKLNFLIIYHERNTFKRLEFSENKLCKRIHLVQSFIFNVYLIFLAVFKFLYIRRIRCMLYNRKHRQVLLFALVLSCFLTDYPYNNELTMTCLDHFLVVHV